MKMKGELIVMLHYRSASLLSNEDVSLMLNMTNNPMQIKYYFESCKEFAAALIPPDRKTSGAFQLMAISLVE
jgi:hypothetical protein